MPDIFGTSISAGGSGQVYAAIGVIYPAGVTCTCSYGGKTLTAKDTSGRALFLVPTAGQWLVKATSQTQEAEDTVSITTQGQVASVTLAFFAATIICVFPTDCTSVTCTKDSTALNVPSGSLPSGSYIFNVTEDGEWVLYATNGEREKSITVNVTEEIAYTVTLSFELMAFLNGTTDPAVGGWTGGTVTSSVLRFNPGGGSSGSVRSNNELDLRGFTKITFHVKRLDSQDSSSSKVGISSTNANDSSFITSATMPTGSGAWSTSDVTKVIDITSVDSGYIKIYGKSSNSSAMLQLDIDKILLE